AAISERGIAAGASIMEAEMEKLTELIDRYIAMWNETDPERRHVLIARTWTGDARYVDPVLEAEGLAGIDAMVCGVQYRSPAHRSPPPGDPRPHHARVRSTGERAPEAGPAGVKGVDFAVVGAGQRLQTVTGFFDYIAAS